MENTDDRDSDRLEAKLEALRADFDAHFAEAPSEALTEEREVLLLRLGDEPYAVMLAECRGVLLDRRVVAVPSDDASFLGIIGHQGGMLAVYDLAWLVRGSRSAVGRWLLLDRNEELAFCIDDFRGRERVPVEAVRHSAVGSEQRGSVRVGDQWNQLIELEALTAGLRRRLGGVERRRHV